MPNAAEEDASCTGSEDSRIGQGELGGGLAQSGCGVLALDFNGILGRLGDGLYDLREKMGSALGISRTQPATIAVDTESRPETRTPSEAEPIGDAKTTLSSLTENTSAATTAEPERPALAPLARKEGANDAPEVPVADAGSEAAETSNTGLRHFDVVSRGIDVTPGNSADSLARLLKRVSERPTNSKAGPIQLGKDKRVRFDQLLSLPESSIAWPTQETGGPSNTTGQGFRYVLVNEGAYLD